jgi:vacuole morphology and inheritance protein 14
MTSLVITQPLSSSICRALGDRLYDKRKAAALEVEAFVRESFAQGERDRVLAIITQLGSSEFALSTQSNSRKGGLIGLAACAIALMDQTGAFLPDLLPPIMRCLLDTDSRVRYYACEAFYNLAKVARGHLMLYFNEIFDVLCRLIGDSDPNVQNGAQHVDRLMKDVMSENENFDIDKFIGILAARINVQHHNVRQFVVGWTTVLDSVPHIDLLVHLPQLLGGLFGMLDDTHSDVRNQADAALKSFLLKAAKAPSGVDFTQLCRIALLHCGSADDFTRVTALGWVLRLIEVAPAKVLPLAESIVSAVLLSRSHDVEGVRTAASRASQAMVAVVRSEGAAAETSALDVPALLAAVLGHLANPRTPTRLLALRWLSSLLEAFPGRVTAHVDEIFPVLLCSLSDPAEAVALLDIDVLSLLCGHREAFFERFVGDLLRLFSTDRNLLETRAPLIVARMTVLLGAERVFCALAAVLEREETDLAFARVMVQFLSLILLTLDETSALRMSLKAAGGSGPVFAALARSFCHSPGAIFCLCLLAEAYEHARALVVSFSTLEASVELLLDLDRVVRLVESPALVHVRLRLLEVDAHPALPMALFGILMCLPQSAAYHTLRNRLHIIASLPRGGGVSSGGGAATTTTATTAAAAAAAARAGLQPQSSRDALLAHFLAVQAKHNAAWRADKAKQNVPADVEQPDVFRHTRAECDVDMEIPEFGSIKTNTPFETK